MKRPWSLLLLILLLAMPSAMKAQERQDKPTIVYGNKARQMELGGLRFTGADEYDEYVLVSLTGLSVGQPVSVPGEEITQAIRRFWKHGLFSDVRVEADSIVNNKIYLSFHLTMRPRVSTVEVIGVKKSEQEDILKKCGIVAGNQITPNMVNRAKIVIKRFYDEKGFKNADVDIVQRDDPAAPDKLKVDILIDKHEKVKVNKIYITGNEHIPAKKFYGSLFKGGILKKTHQRGNAFLRTRKFIEEKYVEDKENIIERYNELGYRDAMIVSDSVVDRGDYTVDIYINLDEGQRYYVRGIKWVGNTIYPTDALENILRMNRGDVYNQKHINDRLTKDEDAVSNYYYNDGYVFNRVMPVEANVDGDSIDLEVHIVEGRQAALNRIRIYGNDRVYEDVIRRELMMKPGDMFSMDALKLTYQELGQMGHFDPEQLNINPVGDEVNGTVDLDIGLASKPSDQVEFSLGWGQTGVIGKLGLKFTNFSIRNLLGKNKNRRGIIPQGDGQEFEISGSTNGSYYQSYSLSFFDPWFGGKRPTSLSVSAFYSKQTDINSSYYNSSYYNNYWSMLYGVGNYNGSYYNNYSSYYDPDKYIQLFGLTLGWGKRLSWPDNAFSFTASLSYTRYMLKDWQYFLISNGNCNSIALTLALSRRSIDQMVFPHRGSEVSLSVSATPPYSLWDGVDYTHMATNATDANYNRDMKRKYRWIEYHKWKFNSKFYTPLGSAKKCFVLMTRFDVGFLGYYNKNKKSPFETFYMGGDGMSGYSGSYYSETIGLRGYDNGALTPYSNGYAYTRMTMELRYPLMLSNSTNIYALAFMEGGNAWDELRNFNPFTLKRSAGVGVRIMLPMVGLMGIDWAYGFDKIFGSTSYSGSQFHFVLGQEF